MYCFYSCIFCCCLNQVLNFGTLHLLMLFFFVVVPGLLKCYCTLAKFVTLLTTVPMYYCFTVFVFFKVPHTSPFGYGTNCTHICGHLKKKYIHIYIYLGGKKGVASSLLTLPGLPSVRVRSARLLKPDWRSFASTSGYTSPKGKFSAYVRLLSGLWWYVFLLSYFTVTIINIASKFDTKRCTPSAWYCQNFWHKGFAGGLVV